MSVSTGLSCLATRVHLALTFLFAEYGRQLLIVLGPQEGCKHISACLVACVWATTETCARLVSTGTAVHAQLVMLIIMLILLILPSQVRWTRKRLTAGAGILQSFR